MNIAARLFACRARSSGATCNHLEADEKTVLTNISNSEYSNPIRVVAFNTAEGWSRDVTEDIARMLLDREAKEGDLSESARRFVEQVLDIAMHY